MKTSVYKTATTGLNYVMRGVTLQWWIQHFPLRGCQAVGGGGTDLRCRHFSVKTDVKMKELDPVGAEVCRWHPPGSTNALQHNGQV